jgi:hypothetical protein
MLDAHLLEDISRDAFAICYSNANGAKWALPRNLSIIRQ